MSICCCWNETNETDLFKFKLYKNQNWTYKVWNPFKTFPCRKLSKSFTYCKFVVVKTVTFLFWSHVSFGLSAQVVVFWGQKQNRKVKRHEWERKEHKEQQRRQRARRWPGRGLVGTHSDMRLLRLLIEMSPTSSSCEANYISNSSWPTSIWEAMPFKTRFLLSLLSLFS